MWLLIWLRVNFYPGKSFHWAFSIVLFVRIYFFKLDTLGLLDLPYNRLRVLGIHFFVVFFLNWVMFIIL